MLVLTRKTKESIFIDLAPEVSPETPVSEILKDGRLEVRVLEIVGGQVRLSIQAPPTLRILRDELEARDAPTAEHASNKVRIHYKRRGNLR